MIYFSYILMTLLGFAGLFLIGLILLQRGRGGGLAGALGGMGGQSWAGTRAGDVFTKITIAVASAWILLCAGSVVALHNSTLQRATGFANPDAVKAEKEKEEAAAAKARGDRGNANDQDDFSLDSDPVKTKPADVEDKKVDDKKVDDEKKDEPKPEADAKPEVKVEEPKLGVEPPAEDKKPDEPGRPQ
jgi:preprotein translocase subunit SecG